jgi:poly [ADP-ribose] polymerase 2/3/4
LLFLFFSFLFFFCFDFLKLTQLICLSTDKQAASVDGCKVVSIDWLLDCEKSKKRLKEDKYIFGVDPAKDASQAVDTSQAANGAVDTSVDVSANKKKSSKKRSQPAPTDPDSDEGPPSKKQKDGQVAKEKSLHVPIDEGCSRKSRNFSFSLRPFFCCT